MHIANQIVLRNYQDFRIYEAIASDYIIETEFYKVQLMKAFKYLQCNADVLRLEINTPETDIKNIRN